MLDFLFMMIYDAIRCCRNKHRPTLAKGGVKTVNEKLLRAKLVEKGYNVRSFCKAVGFVRSTFDRKMKGPYEFDRFEIAIIIQRLELTKHEICASFFPRLVA